MKSIPTAFEGLILLKPQLYEDSRGSFYETWRKNAYQIQGISETFVQDNISVSTKGVLRGLHYQRNQGQLVTVVRGKIFDVAADIRPMSSTYGKYFAIELSADHPKQLYMPAGFAHGFCVLSDEAIISYKCTQYYNPQEEGGIIWNDPTLNISWPAQESLIISSKDQQLPCL